MSSRVENIHQWLLLVSHAAIVGGLVLLAVQINQEMNVAEIQMFNEATSSRIAQQMTMMGENPASIVAKSLTAPDSLTLTELRERIQAGESFGEQQAFDWGGCGCMVE